MARQLNFFDGATSETTPTIGNIVASALIQYPSDTAYEANEQGSPQEGNIYANTTDNTIRYYDGNEWRTVLLDKVRDDIFHITGSDDITKEVRFEVDGLTTETTRVITTVDEDGVMVLEAATQTLTNKEIEVAANTITIQSPNGNLASTELNAGLTELQDDIDNRELSSNKGIANGYASLDGSGLVPASQLPSFVDDVLEFADLASFPVTGESGKIYIAIDTGFQYRWTGTIYSDITSKVDSVNGQSGVVSLSLDNLTDVDLTTAAPASGESLVYNGTNFVPGITSTVNNMNDLGDVDAPTPADGDVLIFNSTSGNYETGASVSSSGFISTEYQNITDSITGSWTNANYLGKWSRQGNRVKLRFEIEITGSNSGQLTVNVPVSFPVDISSLFIEQNEVKLGEGVYYSNAEFATEVRYQSVNNSFDLFLHNVLNQGLFTNDLTPGALASSGNAGDKIIFDVEYEVSGWDIYGATSSAVVNTQYSTHTMVTNNTPSEMNFLNIESGKTYRLTLNVAISNSNEQVFVSAIAPGSQIIIDDLGAGGSQTLRLSRSKIFTASNSGQINFVLFTGSNGTLDATNGRTYAELEELPSHINTSKWDI